MNNVAKSLIVFFLMVAALGVLFLVLPGCAAALTPATPDGKVQVPLVEVAIQCVASPRGQLLVIVLPNKLTSTVRIGGCRTLRVEKPTRPG